MSETAAEDWRELADELHERGGVPERRAEVVALVATGHSYSETAAELGLNSRPNVAQHVKRYREEDVPAAEWLAEHGPEI